MQDACGSSVTGIARAFSCKLQFQPHWLVGLYAMATLACFDFGQLNLQAKGQLWV
jgi:hypothetical protein